MRLPLLLLLLGLFPSLGWSHFQELIPSTDIAERADQRTVDLQLAFTHPMAGGPLMEMEPPVRFGVLGPKGNEDLQASLASQDSEGKRWYRSRYRFKRPGNYLFYLEPAPYWEADEGKMIIHYTKVMVDAFGHLGDWDRQVGFPVEIEPLVRPYGLWTGNLFRGVVRHRGEPVPYAEIEVEWRNDGSLTVPYSAYITQKLKADADGQFSYAMPRAGWWGFAALVEAELPMNNPQGQPVPVEQGGLIWVYARDMPSSVSSSQRGDR